MTGLADAFALMREVPDFPEPGVLFRDLGPVFADGAAFRVLTDALAERVDPAADVLVAVEARGFILGAAVSRATGLGVVPVRKPGKLPVVARSVSYQLEYGTTSLELPAGLLRPGQRAVIVDDVLATGGTVAATRELMDSAQVSVAGVVVAIELVALGGRARLTGLPVHALAAL
ncbi:MAG TPA: adenine phosphoribosyltransferase [Pseudonocardiaceae bacterium]|jgi:adenine phosphoribosyltransferase|nr:adenine phosphoribosyltransferase [Pseudonocardiaceae bacterium]